MIYIYIYVYVFIYLYLYMYIYIHTYVIRYKYMCVCTYTNICIYTSSGMIPQMPQRAKRYCHVLVLYVFNTFVIFCDVLPYFNIFARIFDALLSGRMIYRSSRASNANSKADLSCTAHFSGSRRSLVRCSCVASHAS